MSLNFNILVERVYGYLKARNFRRARILIDLLENYKIGE